MSTVGVRMSSGYKPWEVFSRRKAVQLRDKDKIDIAYLDELDKMLEKESQERGEECVIGIWSTRSTMRFHNEGFGLYTRSEAEELMGKNRQHGTTSPYFADYISREDLQKMKKTY